MSPLHGIAIGESCHALELWSTLIFKETAVGALRQEGDVDLRLHLSRRSPHSHSSPTLSSAEVAQ